MKISHQTKWIICCLLTSIAVNSCDDFINVDAPRTDLVRGVVFVSDETAEAAMSDVYYSLKNTGFASGNPTSISLLCSLSSDELQQHSTSSIVDYTQFNENSLKPDNGFILSLWSEMYSIIYKTNSIIEGIEKSDQLSQNKRDQLVGEAKFLRAFTHFYLTNLWGDVPLILTTDYEANNYPEKSSQVSIYDQIQADLNEAKALLPDDYSHSNAERVRVNKAVAAAFLSRVYLYRGLWDDAEEEATYVIDNTSLYALEEDLANIFRATSHEAIFQLWSNQYPNEYVTFLIHPSIGPFYASLTVPFADGFEVNDKRRSLWIRDVFYEETLYYWALKYQTYDIPPVEYSTVIRLAEIYLNRAEARIHLNKNELALADINLIRERAGLPSIISADAAALMSIVLQERRSELFTEWGHRWFDLIRTNRADEVLSPLKPEWTHSDTMYPFPIAQHF